ncbi:MAG: hypothetical protein FWD94_02305 [Treponema sp.]|nr:hypothetical protein [Treponema sp.]
MNENMLNVVRRIVAENGEGILADSRRLKPVFSDYAKNEPKEERLAFGRCIEMGAYWELKNSRTADERRRKKIALADLVFAKTGIAKTQCLAALALLDAALFAPSPGQANIRAGIAAKAPKISLRTVSFGIAGALGTGIGSLITEGFATLIGGYFITVLHVARWGAFLGLGISLGLLLVQNLYLKQKPKIKSIAKTALIGIVVGAVSGAVAQIAFGIFFNTTLMIREAIRAICWGILGGGIGWGVSKFVPNFPQKRAIIAGLLGGVIGGGVFVFIGPHISGAIGRFIGVTFLGMFIGLAISYIEEALRKAWITVIWGPKETRTIALGAEPIVFGSSPEAHVYLPKELPVRCTVALENSMIVMHDMGRNQRQVLQDGSRVDFGKISFTVNMSRS